MCLESKVGPLVCYAELSEHYELDLKHSDRCPLTLVNKESLSGGPGSGK